MNLRQKIADVVIENGGWMSTGDVCKQINDDREKVRKAISNMYTEPKWYMQRKTIDGVIFYKVTGYKRSVGVAKYRAKLETYLLKNNGNYLTISMAQKFMLDNFGEKVASSTVSKYAKRLGVELTGPGGRRAKDKKIVAPCKREQLWAKALGAW